MQIYFTLLSSSANHCSKKSSRLCTSRSLFLPIPRTQDPRKGPENGKHRHLPTYSRTVRIETRTKQDVPLPFKSLVLSIRFTDFSLEAKVILYLRRPAAILFKAYPIKLCLHLHQQCLCTTKICHSTTKVLQGTFFLDTEYKRT